MEEHVLSGVEAVPEAVSLDHLGDGFPGGELKQFREREFFEPLAVVTYFEFVFGRIEDFPRLVEVGFCVCVDLLGGEDGACLVGPGRIADPRGVVADDKYGLVAHILELSHFAEHDGVPEVDIGSGGVQSELDAHRAFRFIRCGQARGKFVRRVNAVASSQEQLQLFLFC